MRSLTLISDSELNVAAGHITSSTYDLDEDIVYVASERNDPDGEVEVDLWRIPSFHTKELDVPVSNFHTVSSSIGPSDVQVMSLRFLADSRRIAAIMRGGDIIMISIEEDGAPFEVEGTFESGILAAAWNPDESVVAIVTGDHKLILLTSVFDVLVESPLYTEIFGQDAPINVGWGSKQTQFHGTLGKAAAQESNKVKAGMSPDDDYLPRISWRGDGAYFVVSSLSPEGIHNSRTHRTLRVYDRQGVLQSTSEEVPGLEHALAWRPSGNLIVSTQRFGFDGGGAGREGRHDVVFFERNGLRHGEFNLRAEQLSSKGSASEVTQSRKWGYKVREIAWNSDSTVLAIWIEGERGDVLQLWTIGNYHWYLKHEIAATPDTGNEPGRFTSMSWHPERALHLILTTSKQITQRIYSWDTFVSQSQPPNDSGAVAVVDGHKILITLFRLQNVPPPMASHELIVCPALSLSPLVPSVSTPTHITFCPGDDTLGILWEHGYIELWSLKIRLQPGRGKVMDPSKKWSGWVAKYGESNRFRFRELAVSTVDSQNESYIITALGAPSGLVDDHVSVTTIEGGLVIRDELIKLPQRNSRLMTPFVPGTYEAYNGKVYTYDKTKEEYQTSAAFAEFCDHAHQVATPSGETLYVGLSRTGKLYVSKSERLTRLISSTATSLTIASGFVIFTSTTHDVLFVPIASLSTFLADSEATAVLSPPKDIPTDWSARKVERGSRIIVAVPSSMSLVLQMPRGNLETINPRPLVMEVVNQDLDAGNYRRAFLACRKHRVDLNVIVDRNPEKFMQDVPSFLDQVPEVDHINLFLTFVGRGSSSSEVITKVCDAFRIELEKRDLTTYVNSILTAHVVKTPPDHEAGLALLLKLRDSSPDAVEEAVKYIIFLVDADRLFDTALGMYDFSLVIMIAQHAQKDPREYLPFLRELRALDKYYQRFRVDDHLKRYESALRHLHLAGSERFREAVAYVEKHRLYELALAIWRGTEQFKDILNTYGDYLYERREYREAAGVFVEASKLNKAMVAHEKALQWQELFDLAVREHTSQEDLVAMGYRVAEDLSSKKRYTEAARVLLDYSKDIREGVIALVSGNAFSEAGRVISLNLMPELMGDVVHPAAFESKTLISEDIAEMREQIGKQIRRLRELRIRKVEEPDAFYGLEDESTLQNVDVMTDVSMAPTAFTRYTVAPTTASRVSRRTSRSKRKLERKAGRKGTVDEEEYLLHSINKVVDKFNIALDETRALLPHLFQFSEGHREEGIALQRDVGVFEAELKVILEEVWAPPTPMHDESVAENMGVFGSTAMDGWAARMAEKERKAKTNPLDRVNKKDISYALKGWRFPLYDVK